MQVMAEIHYTCVRFHLYVCPASTYADTLRVYVYAHIYITYNEMQLHDVLRTYIDIRAARPAIY